MTETVTLYEVGPRDGLQNESQPIPTAQKIELVNRLNRTGLDRIEVSSFVSPKWVPQLADAADVFAGIERQDGIVYAALTPNVKGLERALAAGANEVAIFASASEAFSQKNINCSIADSLARFAPMMEMAEAAGVPVRGYISCVTDCPYSGVVAPNAVGQLTEQLLTLGCYGVSLGDTLGSATPQTTAAFVQAALSVAPAEVLAGHFHDTNGQALNNIDVCIDAGIRLFDASVGGLGGCPYAPGAKGNVATEAVVQHLHARGLETGIDEALLQSTAEFAKALIAERRSCHTKHEPGVNHDNG